MADHVDLTLGELDRNIEALTKAVDRLSTTISELDDDFVTRREWELTNAAVHSDISNVAEKYREMDDGLKWVRRSAWLSTFSFVGLLAAGLILALLK
jgi:hypothetical protein